MIEKADEGEPMARVTAKPPCRCGGVPHERWRAEVRGRLAAEAARDALSAAFKKIVKRWRDELDELLETP